MSATLRRMLTPRITLAAFAVLVPLLQYATAVENVSPFILLNKASGLCLVKKSSRCLEVRWTSSNRLLVSSTKKCLGVQGKTVGSEVNQYDCDEKSDLQKWECVNGTILTLKGQQLYIEAKADESISLSRTVGPNNYFTISGTSSGACTRTTRELYTIDGNAFGRPCMFPFMYKDRWFSDCTTFDASTKRNWCAVETKYQHELWGYCPTSSSEHWIKSFATDAYYQLNTQSVLTWAQADASCKQQASELVSFVDPHEQGIVAAHLNAIKTKLWIGLVLNTEHGWQWTDGRPFRYLRWDASHPLPNPGHNCAFLDSGSSHAWQSSSCQTKLGYICYKGGTQPAPPQVVQGFCSSPWIPYNGHCFHLQRVSQTWPNALTGCRKEGAELASIRNIEDQSFIISQLGYASTDELWIGLNDRKTERLFEWSDGTTVTFTSWESGKPTVFSDTEDCVLIREEKGNWADRSCDEKHGYICMKQSSTEITADEVEMDVGCKAGWKKHGSYCYFVGTETKTFDEADEECKKSDSYLADVMNGVDNAFLVSLVGLRPEKNFWLGLSNQKNIDIFSWTNTDNVQFTHWNAGNPGYQQGCVAIATGVSAGLWDLLPCTNKEKYICKHLAEGAVSTVPPPTQTPLQCAEGWTRVGTRSTCVKFFTGPRSSEKTWFEARDYCRAIGGDLLSIHNAAEMNVGRRGGKAWIGLHVPDSNTGYEWSDGTPYNFQHWQEGEPNNFNNVESCVEFVIHDWDETGSWNDLHCESYNDWLCQIRAGETPKVPPSDPVADHNITADGWILWKGKQYFLNKASRPMEEARHFCEQRHGDLATINSEEESVFLWKQISRSYGGFYIGLSVDPDGSFWWMDGTPLSYQKWDENQPDTNIYDENCVSMTYHMGFWRTTNCGRELQSICKRTITPPVNTTAAPTVPPKGGCSPSWTKFGKMCYNVVSDRKTTWEEARRQCISMQANLVSIPSRQVQAFLITKMARVSGTDVWIGLNSVKQDGFYWSDGKSRQYTNWGYSKSQRRPGSFYQRWDEDECVLMTSNSGFGTGKWLIKSCNETAGFICQRKLDSNIPDQPDLVDLNIYARLGNDSVKPVNKNLTWDDAKKLCEQDKAHLASLRNEWTHAYVEILALSLKAPLWIGLNKQQTNGYFRYIDGWHLNAANWAEHEPSRERPCVYIDLEGKWRTAFCNETRNSVCMQSTDVPPTESTVYPGRCPDDTDVEYQQSYSWVPYKGHCYLFVTDEIEWADAGTSCVKHGGILASIEDPFEQDFIKSNIQIFQDSHTSFWIGLFKTFKGSWLWIDKTVLDYTNWAPDEPESDFGAIQTTDGNWSTGRRWHDRPYICKTHKVEKTNDDSKSEPQINPETHGRAHTSLFVVLLIVILSAGFAVTFFFYKRSPFTLPTFENPLYFNNEQSPPDVVDTNKLIENAENPEPILTL